MKLKCNQCSSVILGNLLEPDATITSCPHCGADLLLNANFGKANANTVSQLGLSGPGNSESVQAGFVVAEASAAPVRLGRYGILRPLGSGGFAVVYLARDEELHRQVAIKVPRRDRFVSDVDFDRFFEEARVLARFEHPGIVPVYDVGIDGDIRFIVTRYIDGKSLSNRLQQGSVSFSETARIVGQCASAIHAAHKRQIYHRDLKPGNILLTKEGEALVADFGLAISRESMQPNLREVSGTPRYMSPEQIQGDVFRLDGRSDIWSLGVILYRMLTGTEPFLGEGRHLSQEILQKEPVPLRQHNEVIPEELENICLKCLKKRPEDRYQTAHDLAKHLDDWHQGTSATILSAQPTPKTPLVSGDTSEGMSGPTLPVGGLRSSGGALPMMLAGGVTVCAVALLILATNGVRPRGNALETASQQLIKTEIIRGEAKTISRTPGKWSQLLVAEPQKLIFPKDGSTRMHFDAATEELLLHTPYNGFVSLLDTKDSDYRFSVQVSRSNWLGGAGLFVGFKPCLWKDGKVLNQSLALSINGFRTSAGLEYFLCMDRLIVTEGPGHMEQVTLASMLSKPVESPDKKNDHILEVEVVDQKLYTVTWDGEIVFRYVTDTAELKWTREVPEITGPGLLGLYSRTGDTLFSDARYMQKKLE